MANESETVGNRGPRMGRANPLPPLHLAIERAKQIVAGEELDDQMADEDEHEAVKRARDFARFRQQSVLGRVRMAASKALESRKAVAQGDFSAFILPFAIAIAKDVFLDMTWLLAVPAAVYLFIFCWGKGAWKIRIVVGILDLLDMIPVISIIPLSTMSVFYVYRTLKKDIDAKQKELINS